MLQKDNNISNNKLIYVIVRFLPQSHNFTAINDNNINNIFKYKEYVTYKRQWEDKK